jgi:hypothetical protein
LKTSIRPDAQASYHRYGMTRKSLDQRTTPAVPWLGGRRVRLEFR